MIKILSLFGLAILLLVIADSCTNKSTTIETPEQLGEKLFFDPILSKDNSISCASCHKPEYAFADTVTFSKGVGGTLGKRNAPSVMNMASRTIFFYDGRAKSLEDQVHFPIEDHNEMNMRMDEGIVRLNQNKEYKSYFRKIFNQQPNKENVALAIAAYERTLETFDTPFDRYQNGDSSAMSESAIRGHNIFTGPKAKCFECHFTPDFTGDEFRNAGLYDGVKLTDAGRFEITKDSADLGKFKVPGLRNVAITAPYGHNGMFKTLEEVIEFYDDPYKFVAKPINMDTLMLKPIGFTEQEEKDLLNFLKALTDDGFVKK